MTVMTLGMLMNPFLSHAATQAVTVPADAIGITEKTFTELQNATCDYHSEARCGTLIDQLAGSVVLRVEHAGEMYVVNQPYDLPLIQRWIPDGLYTTGSRLYLVKNGYRIMLPSGKKLQRIMTVAKNGGAVGVSESDFLALMTTCESADMNDECHQRYNHGQELFEQLGGSMIMRTEHAGELYYINPFNDPSPSAVYPLGEKGVLKNNATTVSPDLIAQLMTGKGKYFKVQ